MNELLLEFLLMSLIVSPGLFLLYLASKDSGKIKQADDLSTIRFVKQQEMIEGMKYGNKDK